MSILKVNSLQPSSAGSEDYYLCRAWVNFGGTGTVSIRDSGNVSSITDLGTGWYQVDFTNALSSSNFSEVGNSGNSGGGSHFTQLADIRTTATTRFYNKNLSGSLVDASELNLWAME